MAIDFPSEPEVGDQYVYNNRTWNWNGLTWTANRPTYTADRDIVTDVDGYLVASTVTSTEVEYLSGVTSGIQGQLADKAPLASPTFTGTPDAPTPSADQNDTQIATTAFVVGQASSTAPEGDGTAAAGTSLKYARADHVHPTDTTLAPKNAPTFTGLVTVAASGVAFTDGTQAKQGVPSLTTIKTALSASTTTSTLPSSPLTYRDALTPLQGAVAITVDADSTNSITFPIGTSMDFYQVSGTGAYFIQGAGVTLQYTPGLVLRTTFSSATLTKVAANTWLVYGDLKS